MFRTFARTKNHVSTKSSFLFIPATVGQQKTRSCEARSALPTRTSRCKTFKIAKAIEIGKTTVTKSKSVAWQAAALAAFLAPERPELQAPHLRG
jgi:hypothetical protein